MVRAGASIKEPLDERRLLLCIEDQEVGLQNSTSKKIRSEDNTSKSIGRKLFNY